MPEYDGIVGPFRRDLPATDGKQPGDPAKAAAAIIEALGAHKAPLRLPLGNDAADMISQRLPAGVSRLGEGLPRHRLRSLTARERSGPFAVPPARSRRAGIIPAYSRPGGAEASAALIAPARARAESAVSSTATRAEGPSAGLRKSMFRV